MDANPSTIRLLNVTVNIGLVGHGYQVDYYLNGEPAGTECRDFRDTHPVAKLENHFLLSIVEAIEKARKSL